MSDERYQPNQANGGLLKDHGRYFREVSALLSASQDAAAHGAEVAAKNYLDQAWARFQAYSTPGSYGTTPPASPFSNFGGALGVGLEDAPAPPAVTYVEMAAPAFGAPVTITAAQEGVVYWFKAPENCRASVSTGSGSFVCYAAAGPALVDPTEGQAGMAEVRDVIAGQFVCVKFSGTPIQDLRVNILP